MAHTATHHLQMPLLHRIARFLTNAFASYANTGTRHSAIVALEAKSDDELSRMGIKRDEIRVHAFRDLFYS